MHLEYVTQLHISDSLLCIFILFPANLLYWRGTWDLWGVYINPKPYYPAPQWILLAVSLTSFIVGYFLFPLLDWTINKKRTLSYFTATRACLWIYGAFYMSYWRAVWETVDYYVPSGVLACLLQFVVTYGILLALRSARTCIFSPFYVSLDTRDNVLLHDTRFNTSVSNAAMYAQTNVHHAMSNIRFLQGGWPVDEHRKYCVTRSVLTYSLTPWHRPTTGGTCWTVCSVTSSS